jgi:hypothetical protein
MGALVLLIGAASLTIRALWLGGSFAMPANWIALAAFVFAGFVLLGTLYLSRWNSTIRQTCQSCGFTWISKIDEASHDTQ